MGLDSTCVMLIMVVSLFKPICSMSTLVGRFLGVEFMEVVVMGDLADSDSLYPSLIDHVYGVLCGFLAGHVVFW